MEGHRDSGVVGGMGCGEVEAGLWRKHDPLPLKMPGDELTHMVSRVRLRAGQDSV